MRLPGRHVGFALAAAAVALSVPAVLPHRTLVPLAHAASTARAIAEVRRATTGVNFIPFVRAVVRRSVVRVAASADARVCIVAKEDVDIFSAVSFANAMRESQKRERCVHVREG